MNKGFTILLVDDRSENLLSLEEMLEESGRTFLKANSGNEGLKLALKHHDEIGLIMLDVQMPDMDGFEVASLLKSNPKTKDISIIFVTAISKEEKNILKGFDEGAVDYLQKPLDINVTRAKVNVFEKLYFYQEELKEAIGEKERVNKQLERFMYVVAHDLKSPLSGVISLLELIREDEDVMALTDVAEYLGLASEASSHLAGMITSILEYSRQSEMQQTVEEVNTNELVAQIIKLLYAPPHIHINIDGTLPVLKTKKLKLQQVFQNLISNAVKYNDKETGYITIGISDESLSDYTFYVKDNGQGIADKDQQRIFNLFETSNNTSATESSTGVGLNLLKTLVEEQGGDIWVESEMNKGSIFYFKWYK